ERPSHGLRPQRRPAANHRHRKRLVHPRSRSRRLHRLTPTHYLARTIQNFCVRHERHRQHHEPALTTHDIHLHNLPRDRAAPRQHPQPAVTHISTPSSPSVHRASAAPSSPPWPHSRKTPASTLSPSPPPSPR